MTLFSAAMALAIVGSVLGDFLVKQAATPDGDREQGTGGLPRTTRIWLFLAGILFLTLHFAGFLTAMKVAPVTLVVPLMSCTYVLTTLMARYRLQEQVSGYRWAGIAVIMLGVLLLGLSS